MEPHGKVTRAWPLQAPAALLCGCLFLVGCWPSPAAESQSSKPPTSASAATQLPVSRGGLDRVGKRFPLSALQLLPPQPNSEKAAESSKIAASGKITLIRWWTDSCVYCERSLPAIEQLRTEFGATAFQTVAVYHPKPPRPMSAATIRDAALARNYTGPLAHDPNWALLRQFYLSTARRAATSVSFLLDGTNTVRFVHPGPEYAPAATATTTRKADEQQPLLHRDYEDLRQAIRALLDERTRTQPDSEGEHRNRESGDRP